MFHVAIIGAGPAGASAAIFNANAGKKAIGERYVDHGVYQPK